MTRFLLPDPTALLGGLAPPWQPGRPKGTVAETRGRPPVFLASAVPMLPGDPVPAKAAIAVPLLRSTAGASGAQQRVNYSQGEPLQRLTTAVNDWLGKKGPIFEADPTISKIHFSARHGIPNDTFRKYVHDNPGKRRVLGAGVGAPKTVSEDVSEFLVAVMRRRDRANDGMSRSMSIDALQDLVPEKTRSALTKSFDRNIRPANKELLTGIVKAQASTVKRSQVTVAQQWRWHSAVSQGFDFLRKENTGLMPDGRSFGEVAPHFTIGGDETCLLASNGDVTIIGDKMKAKHEVMTAGSRDSITMYRVGSAGGSDGPTAFLPPGKQRKSAYSDAYLKRHGAASGSTVVMTKTGYMTEDAWVEMAPSIALGIRKMPVVCEMPHWWVIKFIDGFGPHTSSLRAMEIYAASKILLLKEEGDSSQVCQAYDQECAKSDKRSMRTSLTFLRKSTSLCSGVIDGWQLITVGLAAVRELPAKTWIDSFTKVSACQHTFPSPIAPYPLYSTCGLDAGTRLRDWRYLSVHLPPAGLG